MRRGGLGFDLALYVQALPVYARNLGVLLPLLIAAAVGIGIDYFGEWFSQPTGGATTGIFSFIVQVVVGFAFAVSVIFADDAWRHSRASLSAAWNTARRRPGEILITVIGFYFLIYVAGIIGGLTGSGYVADALQALAVWAFIYSIPAVAMGGVPAGGSFSASLQTARRHPLPTAILTIVSLVVYYYVALVLPAQIGPYLGAGFDVADILLKAIALGYVALIIARQYADFSFRTPW